MSLTREELAELRRLEAALPKGECYAVSGGDDDGIIERYADVVFGENEDGRFCSCAAGDTEDESDYLARAQFIAALRNAAPALLADLDEALELLDQFHQLGGVGSRERVEKLLAKYKERERE